MKQIILSLLLAAAFSVSRAQDTLKHDLSAIQVKGIRPLSREPISLTTFHTDSLYFLYQQADPFFTVAQTTPNVFSQSDNGSGLGYSYTKIRGLDQTRINYTLNGIPLNEAEDQGIYFSNMPGFWNNIGNVQVERGIGSSKYGNTSIGGSVNMETRDLRTKELFAEIGYGSYNHKNINAGYTSGLSKSGFAFNLNYTGSSIDGFKEHSGSNGRTVFSQLGYYGKNNILKIYGFYGTSMNRLAYGSVSDSMLKTNYRANINSINDKDTFHQAFIAANWINYISKILTFNTSIYTNTVFGSYNVDAIDWGSSGITKYSVNGIQSGAMSNIIYEKNKLTVNTGLNFNTYNRIHRTSFYSNKGIKNDYIAFAKIFYELPYKIVLFTDIQYRYVDFEYRANGFDTTLFNRGFFNPKVGIKKSGKKFNYYSNLGYTQREPARSDISTNVNDNPLSGGFTTLLPEKVLDFELGTEYHSKKLKINANFYSMNFRNEFVSTGILNPNSGLMLKQIFDKSLRTGFELEAKYSLKNVTIGSNASLSTNRVSTSNQWIITYNAGNRGSLSYSPYSIIPFATPTSTVNNYISYKFRKHIVFALNGSYVSSMYNDNTNLIKVSDHYIVGSYLNFNFKNTFVTFNLNNIMNQKYLIPGGLNGYYVGSLRSFFINIKYKFQ